MFEFSLAKQLLKGLKLSVPHRCTPKGVFDFHDMREILRLCEHFDNLHIYRGICRYSCHSN